MRGSSIKTLLTLTLLVVLFGGPLVGSATAVNFTQGTATAQKFGTHEIVLTGNGIVANPFDTDAAVTFTPPSEAALAKTVQAFYDGGNIWRARVYVTEVGFWQWKVTSLADVGNFFAANDPWRLNFSVRGYRGMKFPFTSGSDLTWVGRVSLQDT